MAQLNLPQRARTVASRAVDKLADRVAERVNSSLATPTAPAFDPHDREGIDNRHVELLLGWWVREDSNCIDVGANQGRFLHHMTQRAPRGRHYAFEPIPMLADALREAYPGVEVHQAALYDEPGEAEFTLVPEDMGYSGLRERAYPGEYRTEKIQVPLERLDDVLPEDYVPHVVKIDVEGAELQVFRGARRTLAKHRPVLVFEHGPGAADRYGTTPEAVHDLLVGEVGMRLFDLDAAGPLSRDTFSELFYSGSRWNYVALP